MRGAVVGDVQDGRGPGRAAGARRAAASSPSGALARRMARAGADAHRQIAGPIDEVAIEHGHALGSKRRSSPNTSLSCRRRHGQAAVDPGEDVLVGLVEQRLVAVELGVVQGRQVALGELPEQQIALLHAAIAATMHEPLAADLRVSSIPSPSPPAVMPAPPAKIRDLPQSPPAGQAAPVRPASCARTLLNPLFAAWTSLPGVGPATAAAARPAAGPARRRVASTSWPTCPAAIDPAPARA